MKLTHLSRLFTGIAMVAVFASCNNDDDEQTPAPAPQSSLYTRVTGSPANSTDGVAVIDAVTTQMITNIVANDSITRTFQNAGTLNNPAAARLLRFNLVDQLCEAMGGPCTYKGKTMLEAHQGMNITEAEFNGLVQALVDALNQFNVPEKEQNEILAVLGPMQSDIVGK